MALRGVIGAVLLSIAMPAGAAAQNWPAEQIDREPGVDSNATVLLSNLRPALAGTPARIDYTPPCPPSANALEPVGYPHADTRPPPTGMAGLEAVRAVFGKDSSVRVSQEDVIRIEIGAVPQAFLRTRMARLHLSSEQRYNAVLALFAIFDNADVKTALRKLGLQTTSHLLDLLLAPPIPASPQLPATLRDVTVAQVLGRVAKTFQGVVLYAACTQRPAIDFNFVWLGRLPESNATFAARRHASDFRLRPAARPSR